MKEDLKTLQKEAMEEVGKLFRKKPADGELLRVAFLIQYQMLTEAHAVIGAFVDQKGDTFTEVDLNAFFINLKSEVRCFFDADKDAKVLIVEKMLKGFKQNAHTQNEGRVII